MKHILIVDDDAAIRTLIAKVARLEGYEVAETNTSETALFLCRQRDFNLMILETVLPNLDGFSALQTLRSFSHIPVLILSSQNAPADRIRGLKLGADDYVGKPFEMEELMLRIAAILKRSDLPRQDQLRVVEAGNIRLDPVNRTISVDQVSTSLTPKEFYLLILLIGHPGVTFSRKQLLDMVWGGDLPGDTRTLDTHIKQIRHAIAPYGNRLITLRGVGYRFE